MRIEGTIRPTGGVTVFNREAWCDIVNHRPEFRRLPIRHVINPFTGEAVTVWPPDDAAEVMLSGGHVGDVYWSMSEEALVNVSIEPTAVPLVLEWATELGGEFHAEPRCDKSDAEPGA